MSDRMLCYLIAVDLAIVENDILMSWESKFKVI